MLHTSVQGLLVAVSLRYERYTKGGQYYYMYVIGNVHWEYIMQIKYIVQLSCQ